MAEGPRGRLSEGMGTGGEGGEIMDVQPAVG